MGQSSTDVLKRYLQGAISAEENFEAHLTRLVSQDESATANAVYRNHINQIREHRAKLIAQLEKLGGNHLSAKGLLAHFLRLGPKTGQHSKPGAQIQNAIQAFAIENSEIALYEVLANVAEAAGDSETASLSRSIQEEKRASAAQVWRLLTGS